MSTSAQEFDHTPAGRAERARAAIAANTAWYHTIELAPGVLTPGEVDLRSAAQRILPADLAGRRALDVGTFDGFWAFELERRGASVVAIDVESLDAAEWPPLHRPRLEARMRDWDIELGRGFALAADALGSSVRRIPCPVYELDAGRIGGPVDVVFSGAILLHLRDPVRALERMHNALVPGGQLILMEPISIRDTLRSPRRPVADFGAVRSDFQWWLPNRSAIKAMPWAAGFEDVRITAYMRPRGRDRMRGIYVGLSARRPV
jgi:SAM-dependent methyltransferase